MARSGCSAKILGPQHVVGGKDQLSRHHILAHRPHVLPGRGGGKDLDLLARVTFTELHIFDHDHSIGTGRQWISGVDIESMASDVKVHRPGLAGATRAFCQNGIAVHSRSMIVRRRDRGPDWLGGYPSCGLFQGNDFARHEPRQSDILKRCPPPLKCLGQGDIFEIWRV